MSRSLPVLPSSLCILAVTACAPDPAQPSDGVATPRCTDCAVYYDADRDGSNSVEFGGGDCNDNDPNIKPSAPELCNGIDDNCNGLVDEEDIGLDLTTATAWYDDADLDGYGDIASETWLCEAPLDGVEVGGDCNDEDAAVHPGAYEVCNQLDDDCDGLLDDEDPTVDPTTMTDWYYDGDGDGWGEGHKPAERFCAAPLDHVDRGGDCDDYRALVNPERTEMPGNDLDDDCLDGDAATLIYAVERYSGVVRAFDRDTGDTVWSLDGLGAMVGLAVADDGALYVTRYDAGSVAWIAADGTTWQDVASGLSLPTGIWYDPSTATLLVASHGDGTVVEVDPSTGSVTEIVAGLGLPTHAIRHPGAAALHITGRDDNALYQFDPPSGVLSVVATVEAPNTVLPGDGDLLYVSTEMGNAYEIEATTGAASLLFDGLGKISGLCLDPVGGGLLVGDHDGGELLRYDHDSGALSTFSDAMEVPWSCASNMPADADHDGWYSPYFGGDDCDDTNPAVHPGAGC